MNASLEGGAHAVGDRVRDEVGVIVVALEIDELLELRMGKIEHDFSP